MSIKSMKIITDTNELVSFDKGGSPFSVHMPRIGEKITYKNFRSNPSMNVVEVDRSFEVVDIIHVTEEDWNQSYKRDIQIIVKEINHI